VYFFDLFEFLVSVVKFLIIVTNSAFHHIAPSILNIVMGRLNPFLYRCLSIGHKSFPLTISINIISGRRVIDERDITLSVRELWSMISKPFSSFLGLWNDIFKAFGSLFVEYRTTIGAHHYLIIL
jgi:hypothetical protein